MSRAALISLLVITGCRFSPALPAAPAPADDTAAADAPPHAPALDGLSSALDGHLDPPGDSGDPTPSLPPPTIDIGPYSGGVTTGSGKVWVRLAEPAAARVAYSPDPTFQHDVRISAVQIASADADYTLQWELADLKPETRYYYQVLGETDLPAPSDARSFATFSAAEARGDVTFVVFADVRSELDAPAYLSAAGLDPAFALQIGDLDHRDPYDEDEPIDIERWRDMHRDVLQDDPHGADLMAYLLPHVPFFHMWDDHDYGADDTDRHAPFRDVATQAFLEYFPTGQRPHPDQGLWYSFRHAQAEVFMLDLRSQRDDNQAEESPTKSILAGGGGAQKEWLKASLLASTATWKFIVSTSVWNPAGKQRDSWSKFAAEREELTTFIQENGIEGVVILSADVHSGGAIDDGTHSTFPEVSVPPTNIGGDSCTAPTCGDWSEGVLDMFNRKGFAAVRLRHDPETGLHTCTLETRSAAGKVTLSLELER